MADHEDAHRDACVMRLSSVYTMLVHVCADLPVPITLPTDDLDHSTVIPAVRRVLDILGDIPMDPEVTDCTGSGVIAFLAASDLYLILMIDFDQARYSAISGLLIQAEGLLTEAHYLIQGD